MTVKPCRKCGARDRNLSGKCRRCKASQRSIWYRKNVKLECARVKAWQDKTGPTEAKRTYHSRLKRIVITAYGDRCKCCGEDNSGFLTIDHVNGGGRIHRSKVGSGSSFYRWLIRNEFPTGFQCLCFNCNCGRAANGGVCPHEVES